MKLQSVEMKVQALINSSLRTAKAISMTPGNKGSFSIKTSSTAFIKIKEDLAVSLQLFKPFS
jgi:hypothetical protein